MKRLVTPQININGNSATDLVDKLKAVLDASRALQDAMGDANDVTHGRNFQTCKEPMEAHTFACHAWGERRLWLSELHEDITNLALAIQAQDKRRERV